jgi:hypothetical protein
MNGHANLKFHKLRLFRNQQKLFFVRGLGGASFSMDIKMSTFRSLNYRDWHWAMQGLASEDFPQRWQYKVWRERSGVGSYSLGMENARSGVESFSLGLGNERSCVKSCSRNGQCKVSRQKLFLESGNARSAVRKYFLGMGNARYGVGSFSMGLGNARCYVKSCSLGMGNVSLALEAIYS